MKSAMLLLTVLAYISFAHGQKMKGYRLVWHDEFNYTGLPSKKYWSYEIGHIRNNEKQYYTNARLENVRVQNGFLYFTGRKEVFTNTNYIPGSADWRTRDSVAQYTSASINTLNKVDFLYGRVEVRAKMPIGGGMWPAIWMMGVDRPQMGWPKCGELDIMEFIGNHPQDIYSTVHYPNVDGKHKSEGGKITDSTLTAFHVYALEWTAQHMDFFMDNRKIYRFIIDSAAVENVAIFHKPYYLLLNFAMGASWPGPIDEAVLPQQFVVDYVRYYQKKRTKK